jgi:nitrate reductase delta subunit
MNRTYKALAAFLSYPEADLVGAAGELRAVIEEEGRLGAAERKDIERLVAHLTLSDLLSAQETYVELFDRSRTQSLYLFEHIHGESRDRGQAMVNLRDHYAEHGYEIAANELPDYLPLFLEFLSLVDEAEAAELLAQVVHILAAIRTRLERGGSVYAGVFRALESLAGHKPDAAAVEAVLQNDGRDPENLAELDDVWEEKPAFGGAPDGGCSVTRETLHRMTDPPARPADNNGA